MCNCAFSFTCPIGQLFADVPDWYAGAIVSETHSQYPWVRRLNLIAGLIAVGLVPMNAHAQTTLGTQTLNLITQADGLLYGFPNSVTLSKVGTLFNKYTGTATIQYRVRTTAITGTGSITVKASTDFVCASGAMHRHAAHSRRCAHLYMYISNCR